MSGQTDPSSVQASKVSYFYDPSLVYPNPMPGDGSSNSGIINSVDPKHVSAEIFSPGQTSVSAVPLPMQRSHGENKTPPVSSTLSTSSIGLYSGGQEYGEFSDDAEEEDGAGDTSDGANPVCAPGAEHTGRWTAKEHELFLEALKLYGKEWKKVAAMVKTRTVVQTRTHAQKYFQKFTKGQSPGIAESEGPSMLHSHEAMQSINNSRSRQTQARRPRSNSLDDPVSSVMPSMGYQDVGHSAKKRALASSSSSSSASTYDQGILYTTPIFTPRNGPEDSLHLSLNIPSWGSGIYGELPPPLYHHPSPAACGRRKQAELTAAEMLSAASITRNDMTGGAHVLSMLKSAPGGLGSNSNGATSFSSPAIGTGGRKSRPAVPSLSITDPSKLASFSGEMSPDGSTPLTPWDREVSSMSARANAGMRKSISLSSFPTPTSNPTPSSMGNTWGKIREMVQMGDVAGLEQALTQAAHAAAQLELAHSASSDTLSSIEGEAFIGDSAFAAAGSSSSAAAPSKQFANNMSRILNRISSVGTTVLREAIMLEPPIADADKMFTICKLLLAHGASTGLVDIDRGNTVLHQLAAKTLPNVEKVGRLMLNYACPLSAINSDGDTAFHVAAKVGNLAFIRLLVEFGINCHVRNNNNRLALDLLGDGLKDAQKRRTLRQAVLNIEPRLRTLILFHEDCLQHIPRRITDWEGPDRLRGIMKQLYDNRNFMEHELEISSQFEKASVEFLERVHSAEYISFVHKLSKQVLAQGEDPSASVPFTPHVQNVIMKQPQSECKASEYCDTTFSAGTLRAARRAAGAVAHAVEHVVMGRYRNAFCVVRPPGHHSGVKGLLDGSRSCGFCIFNNVAAGALHALVGLGCERVAIVDLDVHHGNGTEEIVRQYAHPSRLFFFSLHLYDKQTPPLGQTPLPGYEFFPGSGLQDDMSHNIVNVPLRPMWADNAGTPTSVGSQARSFTSTFQSGREQYRQAISQRLLPALRAFNPSLILLSTGFDAAAGDVGNVKVGFEGENNMGIDLQPEDFAWTTTEILRVADLCCNGRVVSVLEGGYGSYQHNRKEVNRVITRNSKSHDASVVFGIPIEDASMNRDVLAVCASAHVHALVDPFGNR